jgi:hypothetical protein
METSDQRAVSALRTDRFEAVPIQQYLAEVNAAARTEPAAAPRPAAEPAVSQPAVSIARRDIRSDTAVTSRGREVPVTYAVVEAGSLVPSQLLDGRANPAYPRDLQPRDRSRATSQEQIRAISRDLQPRLLGESPQASAGAPIVSADGVVESGNGRTLALQQAYADAGASAQRYRDWLAAQGYPVQGMREPVLVRVREGEMDRADLRAFTREANERDTQAMSVSEQAMADSQAISAGTLGLYRGGDIDAAANRGFVRAFLSEVVSEADRGAMIAADGSMSQDAVRRVQAALLARAYGDSGLIANLMEGTDTNIKSIGGALTDVAAQWAQMRQLAADGTIDPSVDQTAALIEAVRLVDRARREGRTVAFFIGQTDMFAGDSISGPGRAFLNLFFRNTETYTQPVARDKLTDTLRFYVEQAERTVPGTDLLGQSTDPQAMTGAARRFLERQYDDGKAATPNLFTQPAGNPGDGAPASGRGRARPGAAAAEAGRGQTDSPRGRAAPGNEAAGVTPEGTRPASSDWFGSQWDAMSAGDRTALVMTAGWTIQDGSRANPTGRSIAGRPWAEQNATTRATLARNAERMGLRDTGAVAAEAAANPAPEPSDTATWLSDRADRIAQSKADGNTHLDQLGRSVEQMRGRAFYNVHDPKERGTVRTVANNGDVVVDWADQYSADKNLVSEKTKEGRREVWRSWLSPSDLKDYVVGAGERNAAPTPARQEAAERQAPAQAAEAPTPNETPTPIQRFSRRKPVYPLADRGEWYGSANYQQTGGKLVQMSPDEYLRRVRPLEVDAVSRENIDDLKAHIAAGRTLDPLAIYADGKEDGRHRAHAAREMGIESVPVLVWSDATQNSRRPAPTIANPLYVAHNLSETKLSHVVDLGGLAAPSLAIARGDIGFENFGDITLVGSPELANPRNPGVRAFNADVYSPRQPRAQYDINGPEMRRAREVLAKAAADLQENVADRVDRDQISREGLSAIAESDIARLAFLQEKGIAPRVAMQERRPLDRRLRPFRGSAWEIANNPEFERAAVAVVQDAIAAMPEQYQQRARARQLVEEGGQTRLSYSTRDQMARQVAEYHQPPRVDRYVTGKRIRERIEATKKRQAEYRAWVESKFGEVLGARFFTTANGRRRPYKMDDIVREMTRTIRDGEGFSYGVGSVRSLVARPFTSLSDIQRQRGNIVPAAQMAALKQEVSNELSALADKFAPYHASGTDFGWLDIFSEFLKDLSRGNLREWQSGIFDRPAPDALVGEARAFLDRLRDLPTDYFEVKMQRPVALSEFTAAIVPKGASAETLETLRAAGLQVVQYDRGVDGARSAALQRVLPSVAFSRRVVPFYSAVLRGAESIQQGRANGLQWLAMLRKQPDVRQEELDWLGLPQWLGDRQGITRQELVDYIQQNQVQVSESRKGGATSRDDVRPSASVLARYQAEWDALNADIREARQRLDQARRDDSTDYGRIMGEVRGLESQREALNDRMVDETIEEMGGLDQRTQFDDWRTRGGRSYRELLLAMPDQTGLEGVRVTDDAFQNFRSAMHQKHGDGFVNKLTNEEAAEYDRLIRARSFAVREAEESSRENFKSSHWDEPNVLAHIRFDERDVSLPLTDAQREQNERRARLQEQESALRAEMQQAVRAVSRESDAMIAERKDRLTDQYLNGELTNGQFVRMMDGVVDEVMNRPETEAQTRVREIQRRIDALDMVDEVRPQTSRSLFIQEIQSDWHQAGRKKGYRRAEPANIDEIKAAAARALRDSDLLGFDSLGGALQAVRENQDWAERWDVTDPAAIAAIDAYRETVSPPTAVPDAPLKKTWHETAFRRAVAWAVENGHDSVTWATGDMNAELFDLSKRVSEIAYWRDGKDWGLSATSVDGNAVLDQQFVSDAGLEGMVGKEVAEAMRIGAGQTESAIYGAPEGVKFLSGENLKIGGEGMRGFYDQIIPSYARKWGKKFGATVDRVEVDGNQVWRMAITPQMRESLASGVALFSERQQQASAFTPDFTTAAPTVEADLNARLQQIAPGVKLQMVPFIQGRTQDGALFSADGYYVEGLIAVALDADTAGAGTTFTLNHEIIHALRDKRLWGRETGLFRATEWRTLERAVLADTARMAEINARYRDLSESQRAEEAIAEMYAEWAAGRMQATGFIRDAFRRIQEFFEALANALRGNGFNTTDSVFARIESGEVGGRGQAQGAGQASPQFSRAPALNTPAFQRWFGDSKVVDAEGKPLVVYHGTRAEFEAFDTEKSGTHDSGWYGRGIYLSALPDSASSYAGWDEMAGRAPDGAKVIPAYVSLQNPYIWPKDRQIVDRPALARDLTRELVSEGYDGVIVPNYYDDSAKGRFFEVVAFRPEQIKSTFNRGTFDATDPRISYSRRFAPGPEGRPGGSFTPEALAAIRIANAQHAPPEQVQQQLPATFRTPNRTLLTRMRESIQDKFLAYREVERAIAESRGAPVPESQSFYLKSSIYEGRTNAALQKADREDIQPIYAAMREAGLSVDDVGLFMLARHAPERNALMAQRDPERFGQGNGSGLETAAANTILQNFRAKGQEAALTRVADMVEGVLKKDLRHRLLSGLISQQEYDDWTGMYQHYVPLRGFAEREDGEQTGRIGRGFDIRGSESQNALGRKSVAENPMVMALSMRTEGIIRAEKNRAGRALLRLVQANPNPGLWEVMGKLPMRRMFDPETNTVKRMPDFGAVREDDVIAVKVGGKAQYIRVHDPLMVQAYQNLGADEMGVVWRLGLATTRFFSRMHTVADPNFAFPNGVSDLFEGIWTAYNADKKGMTTSYVRNYPIALALAMQQAVGDSALGRKIEGFTSLPAPIQNRLNRLLGKGVAPADLSRMEQYRLEWQEAGGQMTFMGFKDLDEITAEINREIQQGAKTMAERVVGWAVRPWTVAGDAARGANNLIKVVETINQPVENAGRLAMYISARENGFSKDVAAAMSLDSSGNYYRRGHSTRYYQAHTAFFGPAVQGIEKLGRFAVRPKNMAILGGLMTLSYAHTLLMGMLWGDDDDPEGLPLFSSIPEYERQRSITFPYGVETVTAPDGTQFRRLQYYSVRLPHNVRPFWTLGSEAASAQMGWSTPGEAAAAFGRSFMMNTNPLGASTLPNLLMPTAFDPMVDIYLNRNEFTDMPIRPEGFFNTDGLPQSSQYFERSTSQVAVDIAQALNRASWGDELNPGWLDLAPNDIEYLFNYWIGGLGRFTKQVAGAALDRAAGLETDPGQVPIARSFRGATNGFAEQQRYYNLRQDVMERDNRLKRAYDMLQENPTPEAQATFDQLAYELNVSVRRNGDLDRRYSVPRLFRDADRELRDLREQWAVLQNSDLSRFDRVTRQRELRLQMESLMRETRATAINELAANIATVGGE